MRKVQWRVVFVGWLLFMLLLLLGGCYREATTPEQRRIWWQHWEECIAKRGDANVCKYQTDRRHGRLGSPPYHMVK